MVAIEAQETTRLRDAIEKRDQQILDLQARLKTLGDLNERLHREKKGIEDELRRLEVSVQNAVSILKGA